MRTVLVTETYFPQVNGVSRTLDRLVRHLTGEGHEVRVLAPCYRERTDLPPGAQLTPYRGFSLPLYPEISICLVRPSQVGESLRDFAPEVVHVATEGPLGLAAVRAARARRLPVVSSFHTHFPRYLAFYRMGWLGPAAWRYLRWFHNQTAVTLCPTESVRRLLLGRGFDGVAVWSRGVDAELFHPRRREEALRRQWGAGPDDVVVAYVGRLAAEKNLPVLLEAFRSRPAKESWRLVLVGDGPLRAELEREAAAAGGQLVLTGYRMGEELARAYASADLFAFPSLTDTFGNVLLEAMSSGLPAVGFQVPGPADVVRNGQTGILVPELAPAALARALSSLAASRPERTRLSVNARRWAESQTWAAANGAVIREYRHACRSHSELLFGAL
jgi:glycosyltransferase involved in cell wall biosynthesis